MINKNSERPLVKRGGNLDRIARGWKENVRVACVDTVAL